MSANLSSQLHHLVSLLSRESDQLLMEQLGIGLSQYKILTTIHEHPHVRQRAIAGVLGQTEASISRQIKLLQQQGLLVAPQNPVNRREHMADLTARGLRLIEGAERILSFYQDRFFASLSVKQQDQLQKLLAKLHENTCQLDHPAPNR